MASPAPIIRVPRPGRSAYNPNRPLGSNALVAAAVKHFAAAEKNLPAELRTDVDLASITTEGAAAEYIRKVTEAIHKGGGRKVKRAG
jgi:hypothetical protein